MQTCCHMQIAARVTHAVTQNKLASENQKSASVCELHDVLALFNTVLPVLSLKRLDFIL